MTLAADTIAYIEGTVRVTNGHRAGELVELLPWQRRFIRGFCKADTSYLSVARGNGKTTLTAALAWCCLPPGPLAAAGGEVLVIASSFTQGRILFDSIAAQLPTDKEARKLYSLVHNTNRAEIKHRPTGIRLRVLGAKPETMHGAQPRLCLLDEPAQWGPSSDRMFAAASTSLGKIEGAKLVALGTRSASAGHWFERGLQSKEATTYVQCHSAARAAHVLDKRAWAKANPSLKYWPVLAKAVAQEAKLADQDTAQASMFKALRLNTGEADHYRQPLVDVEVWKRFAEREHGDMRGKPVFGLDLGASVSMSAVCAYWPLCGTLRVLCGLPHEPGLRERERQARKPTGLYQTLIDGGELLLVGHRTCDHKQLLAAALAKFGEPEVMVADRFWLEQLRDDCRNMGLTYPMLPRGMGWKDASPAIVAFRQAVLNSQIRAGQSLLMRMALSDTRMITDTAGNSKFAKTSSEAEQRRDDAVVAAVHAVSEGVRLADELKARQDEPTVLFG